MPDARIGVVGATGAVGTVTLALLAERGYEHVRAFASARSAGTEFSYLDGKLTVEEATPEALADADVDLLLFSVGTDASRELVPPAAESGTTCIDKSDAFRLTDGIPLVVAGVNDEAIGDGPIVANPNCSAIQLTCVLKPLHDAAGLARVRLATYQSMSGAGDAGIERLRAVKPMEADLAMDWEFTGDESSEEWKLRAETQKILGAARSAAPGDLRAGPRARRPRAGGLGRDRGAALARAGDRDPRRRPARRAGRPARPRATPPGATRCSSRGSVPTRRPTAGSRSGS